MESMVDFVLDKSYLQQGSFSQNAHSTAKQAHFNHRKLLTHLFQDNETSQTQDNRRRISDLKYEQISGQLNYFSEKLHVELSKKHLQLDGDFTKMEEVWLKKKIPDFYSYYFLKFAYANTYSRMHELFLSEIEHMSREKDSYMVIKKTIEAREICIANLKRELASVSDLDVEESLETLRAEMAVRKKKMRQNQEDRHVNEGKKKKEKGEQSTGKSWKNKLETIFQTISHLRKLTGFVVELIKNWKNSIYGISEDPRRFRERVIFFHNEANYLIKSVYDNKFAFSSFLKNHLHFASHYDPFFLKPLMTLQNKDRLNENQEVFLHLLKPSDQEMEKMTKALIILAEQQYDEDQQSKLLEEKKDNTALEKRKKFFEKRRDVLLSKSSTNLKDEAEKIDKANTKGVKEGKSVKFLHQEKKNSETHRDSEGDKEEQEKKSRIQSSLNKVRKIRSVDLKKISPYLSRNDKIAKAQKVLELEHKFKVAQNQYIDEAKKKKENHKVKREELKKQWASPQQEIANNRIFNRYIEENLKLMDEANKKAFLYKNKVSPPKKSNVRENMDYNKIGYKERKEAEYERNLQQYQREERTPSKDRAIHRAEKNYSSKGHRPVIEISNKGVRNQNIIDYELTGRKGKNVGSILNSAQKAQEMKMIESKLNTVTKEDLKKKEKEERERNILQEQELSKSRMSNNLFETQQRPEIVVMRQEPEKIEELKQFLYLKIKEQLLEEMKKNKVEKEEELSKLIEEEKRKKLNEIIDQRHQQEIRKKEELEEMRLMELEKQRKKLDFQIKVEAVQFSEENVNLFFDKLFNMAPQTYHRLFLNQKVEEKKEQLLDQFFLMFLRGFLNDQQVANCIIRYDWQNESSRKLVFEYLTVEQFYHFTSVFHSFSEYLWKHDPVDHIEITVLNNAENMQGAKYIEDLQEYAKHGGQVFEKHLYSNMTEIKIIWSRPQIFKKLEFPDEKFYFGKNFNLKSELLITSMSMNERASPKIEMNLEVFTDYVFLLEELFRKYLTPEEIVQLRENSTNIRRLKDIFRVILELEKTNPVVDEMTIAEGLNLEDLYEKMKEKKKPPYDKYYWHHFYDKTLANRLLLAILQFKLELQFPINSCYLNDRRFLRINPRRKVLMLRSSVYSQDNIYILNTNQPKIRMFLMDAEQFKQMRIELFVFLNLVFNNVVEDTEKYVNSFWVPQFVVNTESGKEVKRITDFSITMKKSFFLSEEIYFANHEYIKNGISMLPKKSDVIYKDSIIYGFLHTAVESASTGMPIYAKMIDQGLSY